jgi:hypothetical protein
MRKAQLPRQVDLDSRVQKFASFAGTTPFRSNLRTNYNRAERTRPPTFRKLMEK